MDQTIKALVQVENKPRGIIYTLSDLQKGNFRQILSLIAFLVAFRLVLGSLSLSIVTIVSMYLHEAGHGFVFKKAGIKHLVMLIFPLGAVAMPIDPEENKRSDELHYNKLCWLLQAGPAVNVALMAIAWIIQIINISPEVNSLMNDVIFMNGLLAYWNLIPVWKLDAGQLAKLIFNSLDEREDKVVAISFAAVSLTIVFVLLFFTPLGLGLQALFLTAYARFGLIGFLIFTVIGILRKQAKDDATQADSAQSLTNTQVAIHFLFWLLMVVLTMFLFARPIL